MQTAFPQSNYGSGNYAVVNNGQAAPPQAAGQPSLNGTAPLQPLTPPPPTTFEAARAAAAPLTPDQIKTLHKDVDGVRKARAEPVVSTRPEIRTVSVDLRPGAAVPILRTMPGETSTLVFLDATGAPWPLALAPRYGDAKAYAVEWLDRSHIVVVTAKTHYGMSNLTV
ncbi:DotH/IcmK family type IV secretion protein, partial [Achromobacter insuavis]|uniref:DotH/IcmK family type IV secretion protein n=1 Tax=Achromobacter insuavis TaxID=1287735 RepID=UPI001F145FE9